MFLIYVSMYSLRDIAFLITPIMSPEEYLYCGLLSGNIDFREDVKNFFAVLAFRIWRVWFSLFINQNQLS